jgi:anti-sigma factor RsiW
VSCLGPRLADLADGRLSPAEADRALVHVAGCDRCRSALTAQRAARDMLTQTGPLELPKDLFSRLVQLPASDPLVTGDGPTSGGVALATRRPSALRRHPKRVLVVAGGGAALAVAVAWAGTVSTTSGAGPSAGLPLVVPAMAQFDAEHAASTEHFPLSGPAAWVQDISNGSATEQAVSASPAASRTP